MKVLFLTHSYPRRPGDASEAARDRFLFTQTTISVRLTTQAWRRGNRMSTKAARNPRTLDRWDVLRTGPPRTRVGRKIYYNRVSVRRWLAAQEHHHGHGHRIADDTRSFAKVEA